MSRVCVHFNIHAAKQNKPHWVISEYKSPRTKGRVIEYRDDVILKNVKTVVQEGARQKVIAEQSRSVHAWLTGELCEYPMPTDIDVRELRQAGYNPYRGGAFVTADNSADFSSADYAVCGDIGIYVACPSK